MPPTKTAKPPKTEGTWYSRNGKTVITLPCTAEESEILGQAAEAAKRSKVAFILTSALAAAEPLLESQAKKDAAAAKKILKKSS